MIEWISFFDVWVNTPKCKDEGRWCERMNLSTAVVGRCEKARGHTCKSKLRFIKYGAIGTSAASKKV